MFIIRECVSMKEEKQLLRDGVWKVHVWTECSMGVENKDKEVYREACQDVLKVVVTQLGMM